MTDIPDHITKYVNMTDEERQEHYNGFLRRMAESYGMHISNPPLPVEVVVIWATRLKEGWRNADRDPGNPHAGDEINYAEDELVRAAKAWLETDAPKPFVYGS